MGHELQAFWDRGFLSSEETYSQRVLIDSLTCVSSFFKKKYVGQIAKAAKPPMNCATSEDREEAWKAIPELARSFIEVLSLPKLGRWFSWNQCAEEQICEFWVGK